MSDREIMDAKQGIERRSYAFRDPVVKHVVDKFVNRSDVGYDKYGRTLDDERRGKHKDLLGYLNDIQEELMDAVLYIQAARSKHCLLYTSPSPRDGLLSRMPSSA